MIIQVVQITLLFQVQERAEILLAQGSDSLRRNFFQERSGRFQLEAPLFNE
jgi:hypothetical protein